MNVLELDERTIADCIAYMRHGEAPKGYIREYAAGRIRYSTFDREVYSYGPHFPLFRYVPKVGRQPETFILNGDRWSGPNSRTNSHQGIVRRLVGATGVRSVIIPFSAVDGAGILRDSIRPIHVRPDANWTETHDLPVAVDLDDLESADTCEEKDERRYFDWHGNGLAHPFGAWYRVYTWRRGEHKVTRNVYRQHWYNGVSASDSWDQPVDDYSYLNGNHELKRRDDGTWYYLTHHHRLGDALISAVREVVDPPRRAEPFESERSTARETVTLATFTDSVWRTYCAGDSDTHEAGPEGTCIHCGLELFARVTRRIRARYLSSFDANEAPPLYFLAQVPKNAGETVESAIESLAPRAVHAAYARGRDVRRQGDIFFIASDFTREDLAEAGATFGRLTLWTRLAKPRKGELGYVAESSADRRKRLDRIRVTRRREWRRIMAESFERAMTHRQTKASRDYRVWNQADNSYLTDGNRARAAWSRAGAIAIERHPAPETRLTIEERRKLLAIYGTAHSATEVARLKSGAVYVRGVVRHVPELEPNRRGAPDHRPLTLGDGWYLAVRNTVPRQSRRRNRRRKTAANAA